MYNYENLKKDLLIGREIEFKYNGKLYSLSNSPKGWSLCRDNEVIGNIFKEIQQFIKFLDAVKLDEMSLKEIVDLNNYEEKTLYIL